MTFPNWCCWCNLIRSGLRHNNICSIVLGCTIFFKKNTSIFILHNTILCHLCICWFKEGQISITNFSVWTWSLIKFKDSLCFCQWVFFNLKSLSTNIILFSFIVVYMNILLTIGTNNTNCSFPTFFTILINIKLNFSIIS